MNAQPGVDREPTLAEVARGGPLERALAALELLLGAPLAVEDPSGRIVAGHAVPGGQAVAALALETGAPGRLCAPPHLARQGAAAAVLLQALQQSECRCRELAQTLQERVHEQVALHDERQRQVYLAERLASIGQLAAGIAHEINNPIGFVLSNLESGRRYLPRLLALKAALPPGSALAETWRQLELDFVVDDLGALMSECIVGAERVARIVRDVKGFSSVDRPDPEDVDLAAQLATVVAIVATRKPAEVALVERYAPGLPRLLCLPGHLNQVFVNLLDNALQAVQGRPDARIEVRASQQGSNLWVEVEDNGAGITPEVLPRVFDPFFTTRGAGRGVGLGLTVARDIVGVHDGEITLHSGPGRGTTACVRLPLTPRP